MLLPFVAGDDGTPWGPARFSGYETFSGTGCTSMPTSTSKPPWRRANPKKTSGKTRKLTSAQKSSARKAAKKAGRRYPNLVDNMRAASRRKKT